MGAGAREGTELKISLAALTELCQAPREPAGERLLGIGHPIAIPAVTSPGPAARPSLVRLSQTDLKSPLVFHNSFFFLPGVSWVQQGSVLVAGLNQAV